MSSRNEIVPPAAVAAYPPAVDAKVVRGHSTNAPGATSYFLLTTNTRNPEAWVTRAEYGTWTELLAALSLPTTTAPEPF